MRDLTWHKGAIDRIWWTDDGLGFRIESHQDEAAYDVAVKDYEHNCWRVFAQAKTLGKAKECAEERQAIEDGDEELFFARQTFRERR